MESRKKYNTTSSSIIFDAIKQFDKNFTAKDLIQALNDAGHDFGVATVYRHLDELESAGLLRRAYLDGRNVANYWYSEPCDGESHFDLRCVKCERIFHIDCDYIRKFVNHAREEHDFVVLANHALINGLCADCRKRISNEENH
jgi:Fur family ferric uptake transcriptional regulator